MKAYVITILDNDLSQEAADTCIASAKRYGIEVEKFPAITPRTEGFQHRVALANLDIEAFSGGWSRVENALACFLSHRELWKMCNETREDIMILEHDAIFRDGIPKNFAFNKCITLGKPSYGNFETPTGFGAQPLSQAKYFKGAHAYIIKASAAEDFLMSIISRPTDIFLNTFNFPYLEEYYPWVVEVEDTFSTIQNKKGLEAKHTYVAGRDVKVVAA